MFAMLWRSDTALLGAVSARCPSVVEAAVVARPDDESILIAPASSLGLKELRTGLRAGPMSLPPASTDEPTGRGGGRRHDTAPTTS